MFSIIVPIYNTEKYLEQCIESVLHQTYSAFKLILVDDGSTDSCPSICDHYSEKDKRIIVIHKTNGGLSDARNKGLEKADKEGYVVFLDSDDYWDDNNALTEMAKIIEEKHPDAIRFPFKKLFQTNGTLKSGVFSNTSNNINEMLKCGSFCACACAWALKCSLINNNMLRFVVGQYSEDIEWCTKMLFYFKSFEIYNNDFYVYRQQNNTSITSNVKLINLQHIADVILRYSVNGHPETVYHFMAEQFILLLTTAARVDDIKKRDLFVRLKTAQWILKYDLCPHVKLVRRLVNVIGIRQTSQLLGIAYRIRSR